MGNPPPGPASRVGTLVAFTETIGEGDQQTTRRHWGMLVKVAVRDENGVPSVYQGRLASPHKYQDDRFFTMKAEEVEAAWGLHKEWFMPTPAAYQLQGLINISAKIADKDGLVAGRLALLKDVMLALHVEGDAAVLPANPRLALAWVNEAMRGDKTVNLGDASAHLLRADDCYTLVVNEKSYNWLKEEAIVSKLFERTGAMAEL